MLRSPTICQIGYTKKNLKHPMWYCYSGLDMNLPWNLKLNTNIGYYTKGVVNVFTAVCTTFGQFQSKRH